MDFRFLRSALAGGFLLLPFQPAFAEDAPSARKGLEKIETIVVLYAENRSFDNLYGNFPGANGLADLAPEAARQLDRDGAVLPELPPVWGGLTPRGVEPAVDEAQTAHLPNAPFGIDDPAGLNTPLGVPTIDLVHRFYQNQMQIDGGRNDKFVAYGDSGALVMGHYDGSKLPLWPIAQRYVLADNFFMGAFGGSFLNHFYLACACTPRYPDADKSPASGADRGGRARRRRADHRAGFAAIGAAAHPEIRAGRRADARFLRDQHDAAALSAERRQTAPRAAIRPTPILQSQALCRRRRTSPLAIFCRPRASAGPGTPAPGASRFRGRRSNPIRDFQTHHQPFNYFAAFAPGTAARAEHLRDGGLDGAKFIAAIDTRRPAAGRLL